MRNFTYGLSYRGKGLGGSSGINFLCWIKPPAEDIDGGQRALAVGRDTCVLTCSCILDIERLGNPGWNWSNFEKYIQRTEGWGRLLPHAVGCS